MSIGQTLAAARLAAGMSVLAVSAATRIRPPIIEAIEADDFRPSGGDFYARAHIREIAAVVGLDPAPLVAEYDASHGGRDALAVTEVFEAETRHEPERRGPNWSAAMAAALALVVVYGGVQVLTRDESTRQATTLDRSATAPSTPPATPAPRGSAKAAVPRDAVAAVPRSGVTLVVATPKGASWVSVTDGAGRELFEGLMDRGDKRSFRHRTSLRLTVGNAGAVALTVNGRSIGSPGDNGEVVRARFTPRDPVSG